MTVVMISNLLYNFLLKLQYSNRSQALATQIATGCIGLEPYLQR